jgi:hypothetical protein
MFVKCYEIVPIKVNHIDSSTRTGRSFPVGGLNGKMNTRENPIRTMSAYIAHLNGKGEKSREEI